MKKKFIPGLKMPQDLIELLSFQGRHYMRMGYQKSMDSPQNFYSGLQHLFKNQESIVAVKKDVNEEGSIPFLLVNTTVPIREQLRIIASLLRAPRFLIAEGEVRHLWRECEREAPWYLACDIDIGKKFSDVAPGIAVSKLRESDRQGLNIFEGLILAYFLPIIKLNPRPPKLPTLLLTGSGLANDRVPYLAIKEDELVLGSTAPGRHFPGWVVPSLARRIYVPPADNQ